MIFILTAKKAQVDFYCHLSLCFANFMYKSMYKKRISEYRSTDSSLARRKRFVRNAVTEQRERSGASLLCLSS